MAKRLGHPFDKKLDFTKDLNALHLLEQALTPEEWRRYLEKLKGFSTQNLVAMKPMVKFIILAYTLDIA